MAHELDIHRQKKHGKYNATFAMKIMIPMDSRHKMLPKFVSRTSLLFVGLRVIFVAKSNDKFLASSTRKRRNSERARAHHPPGTDEMLGVSCTTILTVTSIPNVKHMIVHSPTIGYATSGGKMLMDDLKHVHTHPLAMQRRSFAAKHESLLR